MKMTTAVSVLCGQYLSTVTVCSGRLLFFTRDMEFLCTGNLGCCSKTGGKGEHRGFSPKIKILSPI